MNPHPSQQRSVLLSDLLQAVPELRQTRGGDVGVTGIAYDSRRVEPGTLFVAVPGFTTDGHRFLGDTAGRGAAAVVVQADRLAGGMASLDNLPLGLPCVVAPDTRRALALLAAAFYGYPARSLRVFGVTGTDGKTTTTYLITALLEAAGRAVGLVGTVEFKIGERVWSNDTRQTTPESLDLQALLAEMVTAGATDAVVESSSHALALERVTGCEYDVAVVTNVTGDHLDFHLTFERYLDDKARLFRMLGESVDKGFPKTAVVNLDDRRSAATMQAAARAAGAAVLSYGIATPAQVTAEQFQLGGDGSRFSLATPWGTVPVETRLPGRYNVSNSLAAAAAALSQGVSLEAVQAGLAQFAGVPGRMERIAAGQPFTVIVDYAHTPEGFRTVLEALRPLTPGRVIVVFGCAGGRDRERRFGMGRVAGELADLAVLTNEDPRFEDPEDILEDIATGLRETGVREGDRYIKIGDRTEAIRAAFDQARPGDLVLLAGKGHEQSMIVGDQKLPWDDRRIAREVLLEISRKA